MNQALARRALAEFVGTAFLVTAVIGSGIAAVRLSPHDVGLELLENSVITGGALVALILALQPVSAAFNPVVTLVERALGAITTRDAAPLIVAQVAGGFVGAVVANLMFDLSAVNISTRHREGGGVLLGEVVATLGLLVIIFGTARAARGNQVAYAVGGYILAATGSPAQHRSPTPPSPSRGCFPTPSPVSLRHRSRCSSSCNSSAV